MIMGESLRLVRPLSLFPDNPSLKRRLSEPYDEIDTGKIVRRKRRKSRRARNEQRVTAKAPINTTQFLMNDDNRNSPNSDWERFNSSDSETEYERNEFVKDYETEKNDRLRTMCKADLIKEYLSIEKVVNSTEHKYKQLQTSRDQVNPAYRLQVDIVEKIRIFQTEIAKLSKENRELAEENNRLLAENSRTDSTSDSSSSSSDSSSDSSSEEDDSSEDEQDDSLSADDSLPDDSLLLSKDDEDGRRDDTGYESDRSSTSLQVSSST